MSCADVLVALSDFAACEETSAGSRVRTHCLYPSFEGVSVYVTKVGEGFRVTDNGEAFSNAWAHGRDNIAIERAIDAECRRYSIERALDNAISVKVQTSDWLLSAILTVANASAHAAHAAVARFTLAQEEDLASRILHALETTFGTKAVGKEHEIRGKSGGIRRFDFVVHGGKDIDLFVNAVASHHNSVNSKFVSFSDLEAEREYKLAVFDRSLPAGDASLLAQVATTLPILSLPTGAKRALAYVS